MTLEWEGGQLKLLNGQNRNTSSGVKTDLIKISRVKVNYFKSILELHSDYYLPNSRSRVIM